MRRCGKTNRDFEHFQRGISSRRSGKYVYGYYTRELSRTDRDLHFNRSLSSVVRDVFTFRKKKKDNDKL